MSTDRQDAAIISFAYEAGYLKRTPRIPLIHSCIVMATKYWLPPHSRPGTPSPSPRLMVTHRSHRPVSGA
jgi:hypothetical protein